MAFQGRRHLLTFSDGPRACLRKGSALVELKVSILVDNSRLRWSVQTVLESVLVKAFFFGMRDGPNTKVEVDWGIVPRLKVAVGNRLPLRVKKYGG